MKNIFYFLVIPILVASLLFQTFQAWKFVSAGPRFTANDGKALCERVAELEMRATGTRLPCAYVKLP